MIHSLLLTFDAKCAELGSGGELPLQERAINECLRTIGLSVPRSFLLMWSQKCWQHLDCAMVEMYREKQNKNIPNNERYKKYLRREDTAKDKGEQTEPENVLGRAPPKKEPYRDTVQQQ